MTNKEAEMLKAFLAEGMSCNGATTAEDVIEDNMTCMNANDLKETLGGSKQSIGGVMAALQEKGLIFDSGESARGDRLNDFFLTDDGIRQAFDLARGDRLNDFLLIDDGIRQAYNAVKDLLGVQAPTRYTTIKVGWGKVAERRAEVAAILAEYGPSTAEEILRATSYRREDLRHDIAKGNLS